MPVNRYGIKYSFEEIQPDLYKLEGLFDYFRYIGHEGDQELDYNDLSAIDGEGGPYVSIGDRISGKTITRIYIKDNIPHFEVKL